MLPLEGLKDVVYVLFTQYEQKCFIRYKHETTAGCFISDKAWTANVLNGLKNYPSYKLVHWQNNFRNQRCLSRENQG